MRHAKLTMLLVALTAGATQVALADTADGVPPSRHVNYSDLDMSQASGAKTLYQRLVLAAGSVCERYEDADLRKASVLQVMYGLTDAETAIALHLAGGRTARVIASERSVAVGTVRAQIKTVLAKMGVRRQVELAARLSQL